MERDLVEDCLCYWSFDWRLGCRVVIETEGLRHTAIEIVVSCVCTHNGHCAIFSLQ